jgi:glycosyltransferase involved in cell wall biosynthesis
MKILIVLGGFRIGGSEILSVKMANELAERGERVALLSLSHDKQIVDRIGIRIKSYFAVRKFKYDITVLIRILRVFRDFQPDVVLSIFYFEYMLSKCASFFSVRKPKFVLAFHQTEPFDTHEHKLFKMYAALARFFKDTYIAIHKSQIDFYHTRYRLPKKRFILIHNGVDTNYFHPRYAKKKRRDDTYFQIVHVAVLKPLKDQWTLLRAMVALNKMHAKWQLTIAGEDEVNILPRYRNFVDENNLTEKIAFLGPVSNLRDVLCNADVMVLTSITEALPLSVIEAIAMGIPCIVTAVGGNADIIEHGKQGFLVSVSNHDAVAHYLKYLIDNPVQRKEMGRRAREKAVQQFDFKSMVENYYTIFNEVVNV